MNTPAFHRLIVSVCEGNEWTLARGADHASAVLEGLAAAMLAPEWAAAVIAELPEDVRHDITECAAVMVRAYPVEVVTA